MSNYFILNDRDSVGLFLVNYDSAGKTCPLYESFKKDTITRPVVYTFLNDKDTLKILNDTIILKDKSLISYVESIDADILCQSTETLITKKDMKQAGVNSVAYHQFTVYPNPAQGQVTLRVYAQKKQSANVIIQTSTGVNVLQKDFKLSEGVNIELLNLNTLPSGMYFLKVIENKKASTLKLIKY